MFVSKPPANLCLSRTTQGDPYDRHGGSLCCKTQPSVQQRRRLWSAMAQCGPTGRRKWQLSALAEEREDAASSAKPHGEKSQHRTEDISAVFMTRAFIIEFLDRFFAFQQVVCYEMACNPVCAGKTMFTALRKLLNSSINSSSP